MKAGILNVGNELLAPGRIESNAAYLTEHLGALGIPVVLRAVVGDDENAIADTMRHILERADIIFVSGGLGPTSDDLTREALMRAFEVGASVDRAWLDTIHSRFERRGIEMPRVNEKQALVPEGAELLANPLGTAPGLWFPARPKGVVVLLPGPPRELQTLFETHLASRLAALGRGIFYRMLKLTVAGLPESVVEQAIGDVYRDSTNPMTTILASAGEVEIRLTASAESSEEAERRNEELATGIRRALGDAIFTEANESLEAVVGRLLLERDQRLAIAESITGGLIAHRLTEVPGSSRYFDQGVVTYSNESKVGLLGVARELIDRVGAVSPEVAQAMALGARERSGADVAVGVTGIAGPDGATPTKPVGLVYIGVASSGAARVERFVFPGERSYVKRWASQMALNLVRLHLIRERV
ncbi:MAG TPA: competence/damage-inducible protein A [Vicinamibacteria bacterium]|nr:competence/damage-inducible protein A [Vicinamibacteria bacterium]